MADWVGKYKRKMSPKLKVNAGSAMGLGRYTGNGKTSEPVGVVHGQEYVIAAPIVNSLGGQQEVEKALAKVLSERGAKGFQLGGPVSISRPGDPLQPRKPITLDMYKGTGGTDNPYPTVTASSDSRQRYEANQAARQQQQLGGLTFDKSKGTFDQQQPAGQPISRPVLPGSVEERRQRYIENLKRRNQMGLGVMSDPSGYAGYMAENQPTTDLPSPTMPDMVVEEPPPVMQRPAPVGRGFGEDPSGYANYMMTEEGQDIPPIEEEPTPERDLTFGERAYRAGLGGLQAYAAGESPQDRRIANLYLGYQRASNAAERAAYGQQLAQMGLSPEAAAAHHQLLGRMQRSEESKLAGELAANAGQRAYDATVALGTQGIAAANYEFAREKYGDQEGARMAVDAANGMTWETFSKKYPNASIEDWERMQKGYEQTTKMADLAITAQELNITTAQAQQVADLANMGYNAAEINDRLGTNLTDEQVRRIWYNTPAGEREYNRRIKEAQMSFNVGDYDTTNVLLQEAGLPPIDFSKAEAGEYRQVAGEIADIINSLGEDADPSLVSFLAGIMGDMYDRAWKASGVNASGITNNQGDTASSEDIEDAVLNDDTEVPPTVASIVEGLGDNIDSFWNTSIEGTKIKSQLALSDEWSNIVESMSLGNEEAAKEVGAVIGAAFVQESGGSLNDAQKELLSKYGIYNESIDIGKPTPAEVTTTKNSIVESIINGDEDYAQRLYDDLSDEEKELIGTFESLKTDALVSKYTANKESPYDFRKMTDDERQTVYDLVNSGNLKDIIVSDTRLDGNIRDSSGDISAGARRAVNENKGKIARINGRYYVVRGYLRGGDGYGDNGGYVSLIDLETGRDVRYKNSNEMTIKDDSGKMIDMNAFFIKNSENTSPLAQKIETGDALTVREAKSILNMSEDELMANGIAVLDNPVDELMGDSKSMLAWTSHEYDDSGPNRWVLKKPWQDWVYNNIGNLVNIYGRLYKVQGRLNNRDYRSMDAIQLIDATTGKQVLWRITGSKDDNLALPNGY